jgi:hypothetical protein
MKRPIVILAALILPLVTLSQDTLTSQDIDTFLSKTPSGNPGSKMILN